jgi:hypothetical protein
VETESSTVLRSAEESSWPPILPLLQVEPLQKQRPWSGSGGSQAHRECCSLSLSPRFPFPSISPGRAGILLGLLHANLSRAQNSPRSIPQTLLTCKTRWPDAYECLRAATRAFSQPPPGARQDSQPSSGTSSVRTKCPSYCSARHVVLYAFWITLHHGEVPAELTRGWRGTP